MINNNKTIASLAATQTLAKKKNSLKKAHKQTKLLLYTNIHHTNKIYKNINTIAIFNINIKKNIHQSH